MIGVYKITNIITGEYYIGSSNNVDKRWREHRNPSTWKRHLNNQLYRDIQEYGVEQFVIEVIEELPDTKMLHNREQYWIKLLQPVYNTYTACTGLDKKRYDKQYYIEHADDIKKYKKQYNNRLCNYNGEILTLNALRKRFSRQGIEHPVIEAKKYLIIEVVKS